MNILLKINLFELYILEFKIQNKKYINQIFQKKNKLNQFKKKCTNNKQKNFKTKIQVI